MKPSIYGLQRAELEAWFLENAEKKFRASQVWEWLYQKRVASFDEMTNLSKALIEKLEAAFIINPLNQVVVQESKD